MNGLIIWMCAIQLLLHNHSTFVYSAKQVPSKQQQQQQQQTPINNIKSITTISKASNPQLPNSQLIEKEHSENVHLNKDVFQDISKNLHMGNEFIDNDASNWLNELKSEPSGFMPWNPYFEQPTTKLYQNYSPLPSLAHSPKFLPFFGFPQPIFIPYPLFMTPEMLFPSNMEQNQMNEDNMSRTANINRPATPTTTTNTFQRNSPIYYVRLPPTPYMFLPSLNYPPTATSSFAPILPYPTLPTLHALPISSMFNLPMNFLANGKPSGIYRIDGTAQDMQNMFSFNNNRPVSFPGSYRPILSQNSNPTFPFTANNPPQHESKLTSLKRPFIFNGRPDDIYILPNSYNPLYPEGSFY